MADNKIAKAKCADGYQLEIYLDNGDRISYDLKPKIVTARFQELRDEEVFRTGYVPDGKRICWKTGAELTLDEIMLQRNATVGAQ